MAATKTPAGTASGAGTGVTQPMAAPVGPFRAEPALFHPRRKAPTPGSPTELRGITTVQALMLRSRIILQCATGGSSTPVAEDSGRHRSDHTEVARSSRRGGGGPLRWRAARREVTRHRPSGVGRCPTADQIRRCIKRCKASDAVQREGRGWMLRKGTPLSVVGCSPSREHDWGPSLDSDPWPLSPSSGWSDAENRGV
jgi:hypothetical protein